MDIAVLKKIGLASLFFLLGATTVFARPPEQGRVMPVQPGDFRHEGGRGFDHGGRQEPPSEQDANQRRGKLSPDERRELRRQINEAGQDIYRIKR